MGARVAQMKQFALQTQTAWWGGLARLVSLAVIGVGLFNLLWLQRGDPIWGLFLVGLGLLTWRVTAPAALALFAVTFAWTTVLDVLFGHFMAALLLSGATALALAAALAAYRAADKPLPAAPRLALGSLAIACTGMLTLILAFGGSLLAFLTGWSFEAATADALAALGVLQGVLAVGLAVSAFIHRSRFVWAAVLGGIAGLTAIGAYLSLLLLAQG